MYKFFERRILGIQEDIDIAVLACHLISRDQWLLEILKPENMVYVDNVKTHGPRVSAHNPHPEITLVSYVDQFYSTWGDQLPLLKKGEAAIPYLYVASGIKACKKCHTLLSGCSDRPFEGFNGAYLTSKSTHFIVFVYDHYESGYPRYWIPDSFQPHFHKTAIELRTILDDTSIPSRTLECRDRIAFFLERIIQDDYLPTAHESEHISLAIAPVSETKKEGKAVPHHTNPTTGSDTAGRTDTFAVNTQRASASQFWSKFKAPAISNDVSKEDIRLVR